MILGKTLGVNAGAGYITNVAASRLDSDQLCKDGPSGTTMGRANTNSLTVFGRRLLPLRGIVAVRIAISENVTEFEQEMLVSDAQTSCHRTP
jgi:hypothetical protein